MKTLRTIFLSVCVSSVVFGAAYKIPEQSVDAVALSAANVAAVKGADASYYNPANMIWMDEEKSYFEATLTYINLPSIEFTSFVNPILNGKSKSENFLVPTFFYVSPKYDFLRWGVSFTAPAGLSKKWDTPYQKAYAEEFSLEVFELNPSVSFEIWENLSFAVGLRFVYSEGTVKSDTKDLYDLGLAKARFKREMDGDKSEFGYNLAITYKPTSDISLAATYRSKVDLNEEGNAKLYFDAIGGKVYDGEASVYIPLPAVMTLAASYDYNKDTTFELTYEKTKWSSYSTLDFEYEDELNPGLAKVFDAPIPKNWKDTDTWRIGVSHQYNEKLKLMAGFAIDETPIPEDTLGFELPDADAKIYSIGFDYKINNQLTIGGAYLYDDKDDRTVVQKREGGINGEFTKGGAHLVSVGLKYTY